MALFKKDKDQKKKGQEGLIGKIIYACLLFAPIFSILVSCMYVIFNKNAYQSYSGESQTTINYRYESNEVNSTADLVLGHIYRFDFNELPSSYTDYFNCTMLVCSRSGSLQMIFDAENNYSMNVTSNGTECNCVVYNNNGSYVTLYGIDTTYVIFQYKNYFNPSYINHVSYTDYNEIESVTISTDSLDNVFEYSIEKVEQNNLYNWSKTTGTYTVLETTCEGLGITNTFTPMLLAYWLIISIIYFLYDIALILIWAVHDKIHELKESI